MQYLTWPNTGTNSLKHTFEINFYLAWKHDLATKEYHPLKHKKLNPDLATKGYQRSDEKFWAARNSWPGHIGLPTRSTQKYLILGCMECLAWLHKGPSPLNPTNSGLYWSQGRDHWCNLKFCSTLTSFINWIDVIS